MRFVPPHSFLVLITPRRGVLTSKSARSSCVSGQHRAQFLHRRSHEARSSDGEHHDRTWGSTFAANASMNVSWFRSIWWR
jgi:hypothetical protein